MAGMTAEQKAKFQELLGRTDADPMLWDQMPFSVRRMLVFAAGLQMATVFTPWAVIPEIDRQYLNRAAGELADWAEFTRAKLMAEDQGAAA